MSKEISASAISAEQIEHYMDTVDRKTVAVIAMNITDKLQEACAHVGNVFVELEQQYPEVMAAMGFAAIATCNALPLDIERTPACVVVGSAPGIQHAAQPLIDAFGKIQQEAKRVKEARD